MRRRRGGRWPLRARRPGERPATAVRAGDAEGGFRVGGGGPIDVAAGEVALEVKGAGLGVAARLAEFDAELDLLAVAQAGGGLTLLEIPVDAGARAFGEFDHGLLAVRTGGNRLDHAAGNLDHLAGRELDLGAGGGQCPCRGRRRCRRGGEAGDPGGAPGDVAAREVGERGEGGGSEDGLGERELA